MNTTIDTPLGPMTVQVFSALAVRGTMTVHHPTAGTEWEVRVPADNSFRGGFRAGWQIESRKVGGAGDWWFTNSGAIADLIKEQLQPALVAWANAHLDEIAAFDRANEIARLESNVADMEGRLAEMRTKLDALRAAS